MKIFKLFIISLAFTVSACATMMKEGLEPFHVHTEPAGAQVTAGSHTCSTPCDLELERKIDYDVVIEKPGYEKQTFKINGRSWDPWIYGNVIFVFGAPIAIGVDFYTGKAYDFSPSKLEVELKKVTDSEPKTEGEATN